MAEPDLVIYGCGTQGRAVIEFVRASGSCQELTLTDDNEALWGAEAFGRPIVSPAEAFGRGRRDFVCTIGDNRTRREVFLRLTGRGHRPRSVLHPSALVATSSRIGEGCILMARAVVNTESMVGRGCLLNTGCVVEHHCAVGEFVHLAPGSLMGGCARVEDDAFLGLGAILLPGVRVGRGAVAGAGAVLNRDTAPDAIMVGNPARVLRNVQRN